MTTETTEKAEGISPGTLETLTVELDAMRFKACIDAALIAASKDYTRPILTGVLIVNRGEWIELVSTDSYRLSVITMPVLSPAVFEPVNIATDSLKQLSTMLKGMKRGVVSLTVTPSAAGPAVVVATVTGGGQEYPTPSELHYRLAVIEGEFPNYPNLLPKEGTFWGGLDTGSKGVGFNPKYLADSAKWATIIHRSYGDKDLPVIFGAVDHLKPATLTVSHDPNDTPDGMPRPVYLLMPVRIS
ncbi:MAG: hypothetical protein HN683_23995 [Gammaproteobacteria bacterium]|nr:hypothetical protein [Gammaproteobacteria bacterium]